MTVNVPAGTILVLLTQRWSSAVTVLFVTHTSPSAGSLTLKEAGNTKYVSRCAGGLTDSRQSFLGKIRKMSKSSEIQIDLFTMARCYSVHYNEINIH